MAAGDTKLVYGTAADVTMTLASLAESATRVAGRQSAAVDNTTNVFLDYLVSGKITTGTTPTVNEVMEIWAVGSWDGTTWPAGFDGTDSASPTLIANNKNVVCKLVASWAVTATSDVAYHFGPVSIAGVFGGVVPKKFSFFVTHSTDVNLNATGGNHQIRIQPIYMNVASA